MPRRRDRVAPPPRPGGWDIRYADNASAKGWEHLCRAFPSNTWAAWETLTAEPRRRGGRQRPLKGARGVFLVGGVEMEQWQYEVTGSGRIWYCIDDKKKTVWLTWVGPGHPKSGGQRTTWFPVWQFDRSARRVRPVVPEVIAAFRRHLEPLDYTVIAAWATNPQPEDLGGGTPADWIAQSCDDDTVITAARRATEHFAQ